MRHTIVAALGLALLASAAALAETPAPVSAADWRTFIRPAAVKAVPLRPIRVGATQSKRSIPLPIASTRSSGNPTPIR